MAAAIFFALLPNTALSADTREITTTYYLLNTGAVYTWENGSGGWQNGYAPGGSAYFTGPQLDMPKGAKNVKAYPYDGRNFVFGSDGYCSVDDAGGKAVYVWQPTPDAPDGGKYDGTYYGRRAIINQVAGDYNGVAGRIALSYGVTLSMAGDTQPYDLSEMLRSPGGRDRLVSLVGALSPEMERLAAQAESGVAVQGYVWMLPAVIQYDLTETVIVADDAFDAVLSLPASAKAGEAYTAADVSVIGADVAVTAAELDRLGEDGKTRHPVASWPGRGEGRNSGGEARERAAKPGEITYLLEVTATDSQGSRLIKTDIKTISIYEEGEEPPAPPEDAPDIALTARLDLPESVYEGHTALASDQSQFTVDGREYSAMRMYSEKLASNAFAPGEGSGASVAKVVTWTQREVLWPKAGSYSLRLDVRAGIAQGSDAKPIEVLKTPAVIDVLGGAQKQNRKQTLTARIATNPLYPVKAAWMEITEKSTGEKVRLEMGGALDNSANIKTRAIADKGAADGFRTLELPFLTKYGETREFSYTIYAEDTRGQSDEVTKDFTVEPDRAPVADLFLPSEFLREAGTNVARIEASDRSEADSGDQLERAWYASAGGISAAGFTNMAGLPGYEDLSFGAGTDVSFEKTGVGPVQAKLHVKDVWTDETLPEYVTDADYLEADSPVRDAVVENVAPVVSLSPRATKSADVLLLAASGQEFDNAQGRANELDRLFIEAGIDADIKIRQLGPAPSAGTDLSLAAASRIQYPVGERLRNIFFGFLSADSEAFYTLKASWPNGAEGYPASPYVISALDPIKGETVPPRWSYTINESAGGLFAPGEIASKALGFAHDDQGKYLYFRCTDRTLLFDKKTGAYLTTLAFQLGGENYVAGRAIYTVKPDGVYRVRLSGGAAEPVLSASVQGRSRLVGGKIRFLVKAAPYMYIADFDPAAEKASYIRLDISTGTCVAVEPAGRMAVASGGLVIYGRDGKRERTLPGGSPIMNGAGEITHTLSVAGDYRTFTLSVTGIYSGKTGTHTLRRDSSDSMANALGVIFAYDAGDRVYVRTGFGATDEAAYNYVKARAPNEGLYAMNTATGAMSFSARDSGMSGDLQNVTQGTASEAFFVGGFDVMSNLSAGAAAANEGKAAVTPLPQSGDQILARYINGNLESGHKDLKAVALLDDSGLLYRTDGAGLASALASAALTPGQLIRPPGSGDALLAAAILEGVSAQEQTPYVAAAIKKNAGQAKGSLQKGFTLDPSKTYYYEYDEYSADGGDTKAAPPLSLSFNYTRAKAPAAGELYVQKSYCEPFGGVAPTGLFDLPKGTASDSYTLAASMPGSGGNQDSAGQISFTVPEGQQGILSLDYGYYIKRTAQSDVLTSLIYLDGAVIAGASLKGTDMPNSADMYGSGTYEHKALLGPGTHTIKGVTSDRYAKSRAAYSAYNYARVDNLRFDVVGEARPAAEAWPDRAQDAGGGWTSHSGSFITPPMVTSYAPAAILKYTGAPIISTTVTKVAHIVYDSKTKTDKQDFRDPWIYYRIVNAVIPAGKYAIRSQIAGISGWYHMTAYHNGTQIGDYWNTKDSRNPVPSPYSARPYGTTRIEAQTYDGYTEPLAPGSYDFWLLDDTADIRAGLYTFDAEKGTAYTANEKFANTVTAKLESASPEWKIRNLRIYTLENGVKAYVSLDSLGSASELAAWTASGAAAVIVDERPDDGEIEKGALVYRKGELVSYNIGYTDYESDPSKASFWRYTHTPFNDGPHESAAVIKDMKGGVVEIRDITLPESIDRFYIDGKYTVEHWQRDDTDRESTGDEAFYEGFNRYSNTESISFYIQGAGEAPWVTGIKTDPNPPREGSPYKVVAGVDDLEKDPLTVVVEVYMDGKEVYRYYEEDVTADETGAYPPVVTDFAPEAAAGVYTVVVTVSDKDGTGLGDYGFTVLTEGRVTGSVYHTDDWEKNRKKLNLSLFGTEYGGLSDFASYKAQPAPRKRGTNVFWSGERFMLSAAVRGEATGVTCQIQGYPGYSAAMTNTGAKNADGDWLYSGSLWAEDMVGKWGRAEPVELSFTFTAYYEGGVTRTHEARVIVDQSEDYWRLHRGF
ncbi:MAG: hypothetical protein LBS32_03265 [Clostridiales Family XIII bacterium]|jgi:hypothetical protein|nr:hypothetical protein [Clostridiales Family XIII bacterium]